MDTVFPLISTSQAVKITALFIGAACATYLVWHTLVRQPAIRRRITGQPRPLHRRPRGHAVLPVALSQSSHALLVNQTDYTSHPQLPRIQRLVTPIDSDFQMQRFEQSFPFSPNYSQQIPAKSRDLSPGKRRPITATVGSRFHKIMPGGKGSLPTGYVPVYTTDGNLVWHRHTLPNRAASMAPRPISPLPPAIFNRQAVGLNPNMMAWIFLPIPAVAAERNESNQSMDVNVPDFDQDLANEMEWLGLDLEDIQLIDIEENANQMNDIENDARQLELQDDPSDESLLNPQEN